VKESFISRPAQQRNETDSRPVAGLTHKMGLPTLLQPRPSSGKPSLRPQRPSFFGRVASMHLRCWDAILEAVQSEQSFWRCCNDL